MQTRAFTSTMKLLAVALVAAQFLITGAHAQGNITASGANSQTCFANGACLYVGPLSSEAIDYWMVPQSLWGMPGGASAVAGEGTYYQNLSGYQGGSVPTGWELGLTFPVTATFTEPDVFLSGGIVCGFADICSYDLYTLFPASLNTYIPVLAIQGPAWVCIGPTGGLGCGPPAPTTCAQTNPPPPPPPTVQQLVGISNDAWFGKSGYSPYRVVGSIPASDGKSSATVYERGDPTNGGQIVIAAAGIAPDVAINVFADSSFTTGNASDALKYAVSNMADVVQAYAQQYVQNQSPQSCPASITLTGYSLGGAIAQIVGNEANNNFPTVTFGAPGVGNLLSQFGITSPTSQTDINYRVLGDQESLVGLRVGETITLFPQNLINFFAKYGNTPLGSLAMNNFSAFSLIYSLHFNPWLPGTLANAPSTPGDISGSWPSIAGTVTASTTSVGIQYDIGPILAILTPFNVIGSQGANIQQFTSAVLMSLLNEFDPPAGYEYSFVAGPGSPDFASIELPIDGSLGLGGDVFGWTLTYYTDKGRSGTLTSVTGDFTFGPGVRRVNFYPINASGNPILYDQEEFVVGATFGGSGAFNGTLTTYLTPLTNLPLTAGQSCNGTFNGTFSGNVTVSTGQNCTFTDICEITGNVTINGGSFNLIGCVVDGNVTENGGSLVLGSSASVGGNVQISQASAFTLGPAAAVGGNLQIQNLSGGLPQGTVCGTQVEGNLQAQSNPNPLEIGGSTSSGCPGNTVGGNLQVQNNTAAASIDYNTVGGNLQVDNDSATTDVSGNSVGGNLQCQNDSTVTYVAANMVKGKNQGQCSAFP